MPSSTHPFALFRILLLPTVIAFLYLYFYPAINDCAFPPATKVRTKCNNHGICTNTTVNAGKPPFRLLALADPQLEGDTSLPAGWNNGASDGWRKLWDDVRQGDWAGLNRDYSVLVQGYRKKLDLWGNDWYLAHVYHQTRWWAGPTHTVVLGDLLGSQWIGDEEFERRADRFWGTVFGGAERVPDDVMAGEHGVEVLGENERDWKRRIIAVAGNHDVGYAGDLSEARVQRFERAFGKVNWDVRLRLPNVTLKSDQDYPSRKMVDFYDGDGAQPELRLVVLNSMNLDEPAYSAALREESLKFMEEHICEPQDSETDHANSATVLLTHIPLHKATGVCVDGPFFSHFQPENGGGIREQNHLSEHISQQLSNCLAAKTAIVLNGHDHEGCDTRHYPSQEGEARLNKVIRSSDFDTLTAEEKLSSFREITVRSMMGSYGGYAGFLSGWFNEAESKWEFEYATCGFGVQHIWWVCNIMLLLELGLGVMSGLDALALKFLGPAHREKVKEA
jgi:hypothetical protein